MTLETCEWILKIDCPCRGARESLTQWICGPSTSGHGFTPSHFTSRHLESWQLPSSVRVLLLLSPRQRWCVCNSDFQFCVCLLLSIHTVYICFFMVFHLFVSIFLTDTVQWRTVLSLQSGQLLCIAKAQSIYRPYSRAGIREAWLPHTAHRTCKSPQASLTTRNSDFVFLRTVRG